MDGPLAAPPQCTPDPSRPASGLFARSVHLGSCRAAAHWGQRFIHAITSLPRCRPATRNPHPRAVQWAVVGTPYGYIMGKSPAYEHPPSPCSNDTLPRASSTQGPPACHLVGATARTVGAARAARAGRARGTVRQPRPISLRAGAHDTGRVRPRPHGPSAAPVRSRHRGSAGGYPPSFLVMDPVRAGATGALSSSVPPIGSAAAAQPP